MKNRRSFQNDAGVIKNYYKNQAALLTNFFIKKIPTALLELFCTNSCIFEKKTNFKL